MPAPVDNPYAPPLAVVAPTDDGDDPRAIRARHIQHEASLRAFGLLFLLGGGAMLLVAGVLLAGLPGSDWDGRSLWADGVVPVSLIGGIAGLQLSAGVGLRRLAPWAKAPAGLAAGVSLLNIPVGTVIGGYGLYLVFSPKGRAVLSADYAAVRAQTPDMRPRTSTVTWALLGLLVVLAVGLLVVGIRM